MRIAWGAGTSKSVRANGRDGIALSTPFFSILLALFGLAQEPRHLL